MTWGILNWLITNIMSKNVSNVLGVRDFGLEAGYNLIYKNFRVYTPESVEIPDLGFLGSVTTNLMTKYVLDVTKSTTLGCNLIYESFFLICAKQGRKSLNGGF